MTDDDGAPPPARPGGNTFTIEGRAAPGLFVVGWLATLLGLGVLLVGAVAGSALFFYGVGPGLLSIGLIAGAGSQALERRARGEAYAGPSPLLVFAAILATSVFLAAVVGEFLAAVGVPRDPPLRQLIGVSLQAVVFLGIVRLCVVGTGALSWRQMGFSPLDRRAASDLLSGALLAFPVILLTGLVAAALLAVFRTAPPSPLPPTGTVSGLFIQLIAGAVIAPVVEEVVFRGFALTAWARTLGPGAAILRSAVLFAVAHVITTEGASLREVAALVFVGAAGRLPVALALGWLFARRRSIWAPIGLHATFNAVLLLLAEWAIRNSSSLPA